MVELHPEQARTLLGNLAIGLMMFDREQCVSWVNDYAADLLETDARALLGRHVRELAVPYSDLRADDNAQVRVDGTLVGITQPLRHPHGDGSILTMLDRGHALVWFLSALSSGVPDTVAASGILSRAATAQRLDAEVSRSRRYSNPLSCIAVTAQGASQAAVADIARTLKGQLRWVDQLGQWCDDMLLVVLPETNFDAAGNLAGKLTEALAVLPTSGSSELALGAAAWQRGDTGEHLVERALAAAETVSQSVRRLKPPARHR